MPRAATSPARRRTTAPATKVKRKASERRRNFVLISGAVLVSAFMLVAWFPAQAILTQRQALSASTAQLNSMKSQDAALIHEAKTLTSSADVTRLAREEYQLVQPGQRLVQVLPPSGAPTASTVGQAPSPGDPGLAKPGAPSAIALLPTGTTTTTTTPPTSSTVKTSGTTTSTPTKAGPKSLWQRVAATLTFWKQ